MDTESILDLLNELTDLADDAESYKPTQAQLISSIRKIRDGAYNEAMGWATSSPKSRGAYPPCHLRWLTVEVENMTQRMNRDLQYGIHQALSVLNEIAHFEYLVEAGTIDAYGDYGGEMLPAYEELLDRISGKAERAMQTIGEACDSDEPIVTPETT